MIYTYTGLTVLQTKVFQPQIQKQELNYNVILETTNDLNIENKRVSKGVYISVCSS